MSFYNDLKILEIENSTICNARCPQCLREELPLEGFTFEETYLETDFFENYIPQKIYDGLTKIHFGGTLGDPCAAPNFLDVIRVVKRKNPNMMISVSTNGGMKSSEWWATLAGLLTPKDQVSFAIDGLEDTNHIYRVNVSWKKLMENAKSFIQAGGRAGWQFIVFRHNEHQTDQAAELAKELGFGEFILKKPHRFPVSTIKGIPVVGSTQIEILPPLDPKFSTEMKAMPDVKNWKEMTKDLQINCDAKLDSSAYIDAFGRLFPCCYTAAAVYVYPTKFGRSVDDDWDAVWDSVGDKHINLKTHDWNSIVDGGFFKELENRWTSCDRIGICVLECGLNGKVPNPTVSRFVDR